MDFKKLDDIVENFVRTENNQTDIENLPKIIPLCEEIISNKDFFPIETKHFSTNYDLNKKIQLISEFLGTIDISLKNQFVETSPPIFSSIWLRKMERLQLDLILKEIILRKAGHLYI